MTQADRGARQLVAAALACLCLTTGCDQTRTTWDVIGSYQATYTSEAGAVQNVSGSVSWTGRGVSQSDPARMCDIRSVQWQVPESPVRGTLAAIVTDLPRALCQTGTDSIAGTYAITWEPPGSDTTVVTGARSDLWQATGTMTVIDYMDLHPPEPELNSSVHSETAHGTFSVVARGPNARTVRLENGVFTFTIDIRRSSYNPLE